MSGDVQVCEVCLCSETGLKNIDINLSNFHDEICDYSRKSRNPQYCPKCEQILENFHNFKNRCINAQKILSTWRKKKGNKMRIDKLYTQLSFFDECSDKSKLSTKTKVKKSLSKTNKNQASPKICDPILKVNMEPNLETKLKVITPILVPMNKFHSSMMDIPVEPEIYIKEVVKIEPNYSNDAIDSLDIDRHPISELKTEASSPEPIDDTTKHIDDCLDLNSHNISLNMDIINEIDGVLNQSDDEDMKPLKTLAKLIKVDGTDIEKGDKKMDVKETADNTDDSNDEVVEINANNSADTSDDEENDKNIFAKLDILTKDTSSIYDFYQSALVSDRKNELNAIFKRQKKIRRAIKMLENLTDAVEGLREDFENVVKCKDQYNESYRYLQTKETIIQLVKETITSTTGCTLDMQFISRCLNEMVPPSYLKLLCKNINSKALGHRKRATILRMMSKLEKKYKDPLLDSMSEILQIEYLNTEEKIREDFESRKSEPYYQKAKFKCETCFLGFKFHKSLDRHSVFHNKSNGSYTCNLCKGYYESLKCLTAHNSYTHRMVFRCTLCSMVTRNRAAAEGHYNRHKGNKIQCDICGQGFNWIAVYYRHLLDKHGCNFVCTICAVAFPTEQKLEEHKSRHIKRQFPEPTVQCEHCGLKFVSQQVCDRHINLTHKDRSWGRPLKTDPYKQYKIKKTAKQYWKEKCECDHCGATFSSLRQCRSHITWQHNNQTENDTNNKVRICPVCDEKLPSYPLLVNHFISAHPALNLLKENDVLKSHLCDHCGKKFMNEYHLKEHILGHSGELGHACTECPRRFASRTQLRHHLLYHKPKSCQCKYCGKMFRTPSNLSNHTRVHVQDRKYKCYICGKGFLHKNSVNSHIKGVHNKIRRVKKTQAMIANNTDNTENALTDTGNVFPATGNVFPDAGNTANVFSDAGNVFNETGNVYNETGNVFTVTGNVFTETGSKRMPEREKDARVFRKSAKRRRREYGTDTEDSE